MELINSTKLSFLALSLLGFTHLSFAGTMGPVEEPLWNGVYVGLNAGGLWGENQFYSNNLGSAYAAGIPLLTDATLKDTGFIGGAQIGWNYQYNSLAFGVEGDLDYANLNVNRTASSPTASTLSAIITQHFSTDWISTIRGRVGYAANKWWVYGTGGLALAKMNLNDQVCSGPTALTPGCASMAQDKVDWGWTAGAGLEWKFSTNLSAKAEYLYVDLDNSAYTSLFTNTSGVIIPNSNINHNHEFTANIARVGINYFFS
ncbi:MAG: porin family protein [Legionella sp.]|nr:MAG: porin family protein [Legionella sp.]